MRYAYTAKSTSGALSSGMLDAESPVEAHRQLRERGMFALSVSPGAAGAHGAAGGPLRRRKKVPKRDLMTLTAQLAIMTRAGVDLAGALQTTARQCGNPSLKQTLLDVHQEVAAGHSISASLRKHVQVFGDAYVASVAAGEASGRLPEVFQRLTQMLRGELRLRSTIRSLMAYPIVLASVSTMVLMGLVFFVLPQFAGIFEQFEVPLPAITQVLLAISGELRGRFWLWLPALGGGLITLVMFSKSGVGRRCIDAVLLHTVLVRDITRALLIGRTFRLLGIMIESGVPLLEGLRLTRASLKNYYYKQLFRQLEQDILNGQGMGETLAKASFVPPAAAEMVLTGQRTGTLGMVTATMGEFYEEEGESRLSEFAKVLEPAIIVVMGVIVATVVLSVMLPMFDFATFANKA